MSEVEYITLYAHQYATASNKYMKDYDENKEFLYFDCWDVNNLHGWAMSQKLPLGGFKWVEYTSQFNKDFIKNCNGDSDATYFL